jgi:hypothetical protein
MLDLIIFLKSDGGNANSNDLTITISSIENTIGAVNYKYYFVLNAMQEQTILDLIKLNILDQEKILEIKNSTASWAYEYNVFFDLYKDSTKYIITSHDDMIMRTSNFFNHSLELMKDKEKEIGWVTYTCDTFYREFGRPWGVSVRMGFAKDYNKWPYVYECHKFNESYTKGRCMKFPNMFDMPKSGTLVKAHAPYTVFNLISVESMKIIGPCEDWTPYTMLIDEDWGLTALKNNLWNIWIPDIFYTHPLVEHANRWEKEAHKGFIDKWGFDEAMLSKKQIEEIREKYKDTLVPWSSYYNTYDWQYL